MQEGSDLLRGPLRLVEHDQHVGVVDVAELAVGSSAANRSP